MFLAFHNARRFTYKHLGLSGVKLTDFAKSIFQFDHAWEKKYFSDLKDWSKGFNDLENWVNLNSLVSMASCLEIYIATIVPLALESDIGVLFGTPKKIDGIEIIKHGKPRPFDFSEYEIGCTKGDWQSRLQKYEKAFAKVPSYVSKNISTLERMRNMRNDVAHAMGRDIEESRKAGAVKTLPSAKMEKEKFLKIQSVIWNSALAIDQHLFKEHIGEFQSLVFYHELYPSLNRSIHANERAVLFKKKIGAHGEMPAGKEFCRGLVKYYEGL
jgi:hypothetical protein